MWAAYPFLDQHVLKAAFLFWMNAEFPSLRISYSINPTTLRRYCVFLDPESNNVPTNRTIPIGESF